MNIDQFLEHCAIKKRELQNGIFDPDKYNVCDDHKKIMSMLYNIVIIQSTQKYESHAIQSIINNIDEIIKNKCPNCLFRHRVPEELYEELQDKIFYKRLEQEEKRIINSLPPTQKNSMPIFNNPKRKHTILTKKQKEEVQSPTIESTISMIDPEEEIQDEGDEENLVNIQSLLKGGSKNKDSKSNPKIEDVKQAIVFNTKKTKKDIADMLFSGSPIPSPSPPPIISRGPKTPDRINTPSPPSTSNGVPKFPETVNNPDQKQTKSSTKTPPLRSSRSLSQVKSVQHTVNNVPRSKTPTNSKSSKIVTALKKSTKTDDEEDHEIDFDEALKDQEEFQKKITPESDLEDKIKNERYQQQLKKEKENEERIQRLALLKENDRKIEEQKQKQFEDEKLALQKSIDEKNKKLEEATKALKEQNQKQSELEELEYKRKLLEIEKQGLEKLKQQQEESQRKFEELKKQREDEIKQLIKKRQQEEELELERERQREERKRKKREEERRIKEEQERKERQEMEKMLQDKIRIMEEHAQVDMELRKKRESIIEEENKLKQLREKEEEDRKRREEEHAKRLEVERQANERLLFMQSSFSEKELELQLELKKKQYEQEEENRKKEEEKKKKDDEERKKKEDEERKKKEDEERKKKEDEERKKKEDEERKKKEDEENHKRMEEMIKQTEKLQQEVNKKPKVIYKTLTINQNKNNTMSIENINAHHKRCYWFYYDCNFNYQNIETDYVYFLIACSSILLSSIIHAKLCSLFPKHLLLINFAAFYITLTIPDVFNKFSYRKISIHKEQYIESLQFKDADVYTNVMLLNKILPSPDILAKEITLHQYEEYVCLFTFADTIKQHIYNANHAERTYIYKIDIRNYFVSFKDYINYDQSMYYNKTGTLVPVPVPQYQQSILQDPSITSIVFENPSFAKCEQCLDNPEKYEFNNPLILTQFMHKQCTHVPENRNSKLIRSLCHTTTNFILCEDPEYIISILK